MININMEKAREIWRNKIRKEREKLFKELDIAYQRADESNNVEEKARIAAEKQKLRDATNDPAIELADTPADLKNVWPL